MANFDTHILISIVLFNACRVGAAFVDIDQAGFAVRADGFVQKSPGCFSITLGSQQKVDSITFFVHGTIEIFPLTLIFWYVSSRRQRIPVFFLFCLIT